jgi:hypothetical protein
MTVFQGAGAAARRSGAQCKGATVTAAQRHTAAQRQNARLPSDPSSGSPHGLPLATVGNPVEPLLQVGPLYTARGTVFAVTPTR